MNQNQETGSLNDNW